MAAGPIEIVEYRQQLHDHERLGAFAGRLLIAQRALAVVGEVGLHPLQITEQFGGLVGLLRRLTGEGPRHRPTEGRAGDMSRVASLLPAGVADLPGLRVDPALVGDGHRFLAVTIPIRVSHLGS